MLAVAAMLSDCNLFRSSSAEETGCATAINADMLAARTACCGKLLIVPDCMQQSRGFWHGPTGDSDLPVREGFSAMLLHVAAKW